MTVVTVAVSAISKFVSAEIAYFGLNVRQRPAVEPPAGFNCACHSSKLKDPLTMWDEDAARQRLIARRKAAAVEAGVSGAGKVTNPVSFGASLLYKASAHQIKHHHAEQPSGSRLGTRNTIS